MVSNNLPMTIKVVCVNTITNYNDTRILSPMYEGSCMVYKFKWY